MRDGPAPAVPSYKEVEVNVRPRRQDSLNQAGRDPVHNSIDYRDSGCPSLESASAWQREVS